MRKNRSIDRRKIAADLWDALKRCAENRAEERARGTGDGLAFAYGYLEGIMLGAIADLYGFDWPMRESERDARRAELRDLAAGGVRSAQQATP